MKEYVEMGLLLDAISVSKLDYLAVTDVVCKVPTADVVPVVHGEWQDIGVWSEVNRVKINSCSNCYYHYVGFGNEFAYCPSCGAKMDGKYGTKN